MSKRRTVVNTQAELAEVLGVGKGSITRWKRKGLPVRDDGKFDVAACEKWIRDKRHKVDGRAAKAGTGMGAAEALETIAEQVPDAQAEELRKWAIEWRRTRTMQSQLKLAEAQGELIPREEVVRLFVLRCSEIRAGLLGMRRRLLPELLRLGSAVGKHRKAIAAILERHGLQLLETFSREHKLVGDPDSREEEAPPAAPPKKKKKIKKRKR